MNAAVCKFLAAACPYAEWLGRIAIAVLFLLAGVAKLGSDFAGVQGYMESAGVPGMFLPAVIGVEIGGGILLVIGWKTRLAALALAGFSVLTAVLFHFDFADRVESIFFMKNFAIAGGLLVLAHAGAGRFSIDRFLRARAEPPAATTPHI